ncbi:conjugal transfer protein TraF [Helicobacter baculiformis]|uniref:Conjugal transfer protein TraF n=1 Tax=Helicobacter baculiformis TaxID=427351 RepID=A0ABV7ZLS1_9HELI|nr:conjugal transfer protein TraF [Helicobacter baculiformis]
MANRSRYCFELWMLMCASMGALEFGQMGDTSFAMGGAGVALENSAWGLYYNPALLDVDARSKLGYSFGVSLGSKNILPLISAARQSSQALSSLDIGSLLTQNNLQFPLTFSANQGSSAQAVIKMANAAKNFLSLNGVQLDSQNGLVLQIHPRLKSRREIGTFAVGIFASGFIGAGVQIDPKYNQLILKASIPQIPPKAGNNLQYLSAGISPTNITFSQSSEQNFNSSSMFSPNAQHSTTARVLALGSVPFGYAKGINFGRFGMLSIGADARYIYSLSYGMSVKGNLDSLINNTSNTISGLNFNNLMHQNHFGLDLGMVYRIKGVSVGLVGKYLNAPKISYSDGLALRIEPQVRMGLGWRWKWLNLAWDLDLTSNKTLIPNIVSQMTGGGLMASFRWFALKFGAMGNLAKKSLHQGVILTGGVRLFKILDVSIQSGLQTTLFNGVKIPNYMALRIGGGWEW